MKKIAILIIMTYLIFHNYEKIDEVFFQINLSRNKLNYNEDYFFDLNGDSNHEKIKLISTKDKNGNVLVSLYINDKLEEKYKDENNVSVHIYDFNKVDKNKEIYVTLGNKFEYSKINIFTYNNEGKSENITMDGRIVNNDDKSGRIKIAYGNNKHSPLFNNYSQVIGGESIVIDYIYKRVVGCDLEDVEISEVKVVGDSEEKEYIAKEDIAVYETKLGNVKAYTISKGEKIKLVSLCNHNNNQSIKVVNKEGRYGWVKVENKQIFQSVA